jgi:hypothetical protein
MGVPGVGTPGEAAECQDSCLRVPRPPQSKASELTMNIKHVAAAAAAIGLGISTLTVGTPPVKAAPLVSAPECPACEPGQAPGIPALKCWPYGRVGGGNAVSGGGQPSYPPPCR